jgi:hypothetical protein
MINKALELDKATRMIRQLQVQAQPLQICNHTKLTQA